jgi:sRNA-binding carbon storage regulator CsrA
MLVLTRSTSESIIISGPGLTRPIVLTILRSPGKVRLGIDADPSLQIDRDEVHNRKQAEREGGAA